MKLYLADPFPPLVVFGALLTLSCVLVAFIWPSWGARFLESVENLLRSLGGRPKLAMLILAVLPVILRLALIPVCGVPTPFIHDEFAYLLQADTFASGRLTNPPHPLWRHFESIYILSQPTYTAQYPIAQGLVLAMGQVLTHLPWTGVLLSMALLCALLYWMLLAWLPRGWAMTGGLLAVCQWGVLSYWVNSYWGATVPAIGGVLICGALPRLRKEPNMRHALILAAGLVILFNSRPLEGLLFAFVIAAAVLYWLLATKELSFGAVVPRVVVPVGLILVAAVSFMAYYNLRVTGEATELPYTLHRKLYGTPQGFFWQKPYIVKASMPRDIRMEYEDQLRRHASRNSITGLLRATARKLQIFWLFYITIPLTIPLVFLPFIWGHRNMGIVLALAAIFAFEILTYHAFFPQYAAPFLGGIIIILLRCMRRMRESGATGLFLSRSLPCVCLILFAVPVLGRVAEPVLPPQLSFLKALWETEFWPEFQRVKFERFLQSRPGKQLVLVHYEYPSHSVHSQWVYNRADIDRSKIVWARELDPESNRRLLDYYRDRTVWIAEPDRKPPRLEGPISKQGLTKSAAY